MFAVGLPVASVFPSPRRSVLTNDDIVSPREPRPRTQGDRRAPWICATEARRMMEGSGAGAVVRLHGWESWYRASYQRSAEFCRVITDAQTPYRVYGAQPEKRAITVSSRSAIS